jgi:hypothetical protein
MVKRSTIGIVTLVVSAPFYAWFFPSLFLGKLPRAQIVIPIFWVYAVVGYIVVITTMRRLPKDKLEWMDARPQLQWVALLGIFALVAVIIGVYDLLK